MLYFTQGISNSCPTDKELGTLTKWLASWMLVWFLAGFSSVQYIVLRSMSFASLQKTYIDGITENTFAHYRR
jgi:hypothetical protein